MHGELEVTKRLFNQPEDWDLDRINKIIQIFQKPVLHPDYPARPDTPSQASAGQGI